MTDIPPSIPDPPAEKETVAGSPTRFGVGATVGDAFTIFFRNFWKLAVLALMVYVPMYGLIFAAAWWSDPTAPMGMLETSLVFVGTMLFVFVLTGAVVRGVYEQMQGRPFRIGDCLHTALGRLGPLLIASAVAVIITVAGFVILIIPGIIAILIFYAVPAVVVVERSGPFEALSRSADLTEGYRLEILGVIVLLAITTSIISMLVGFVLGMFSMADPTGIVVPVILQVFNGVMSMVPTVATAVVYYKLRRVKEGVDLDDLASVFA